MSDVLIVGGGPVGLAAAIEARLAGMSVTVAEPRIGTIDKACGEVLLPGAVPMLQRLGIEPPGMPLRGVAFFGGGEDPWRVEHRFSSGVGLGLRRVVLHALLTERAEELGIVRGYGRLQGLNQDAHAVTALTDLGETIRCKWLIGCDGLRSATARLAGLSDPHPPRHERFAVRRHFAVEPWSDVIEVHYGSDAEASVTPVGHDLVDVSVLGPRGVAYRATINSIPELERRLRGAPAVTEARGAGPFPRRTTARTSGRVLLAGDASGYVDAITSEGLRTGFAQAKAAIDAIRRGRPAEYEREWQRVTRPYNLITSGLVGAGGTALRSGLVATAAKAPRVFGAVMERLTR
ncbi:NAD(P)/FAD-dependent oxidoreductase [Salinibacterium sp. SYSU T00001]|uniref:NAD(P)/FAD-dependent oxidoreductase n=1 Tax=Homoserinimonas sedimenticola TaxID=2986805 RepID=UPI002236BA44|nr:NAD(P)/FAD-dependent oxidoreductase [Salinibacterium sedimenticola]MCW4385836.1 NAD(P)/FAD-dependent oxidoreductase [Salinibacterium sedimenticola]